MSFQTLRLQKKKMKMSMRIKKFTSSVKTGEGLIVDTPGGKWIRQHTSL